MDVRDDVASRRVARDVTMAAHNTRRGCAHIRQATDGNSNFVVLMYRINVSDSNLRECVCSAVCGGGRRRVAGIPM